MIANTLEATLTNIVARLRQGRFLSVCHPEHVEGSHSPQRLRERREVATNLNNILKRTIIKLATEVAGLTFGKDVVVEF